MKRVYLRKMYDNGTVCIPPDIRKKFCFYRFDIYVSNGKIVLEPSEHGRVRFREYVFVIPAEIRMQFNAKLFKMYVEDGKIILEPVEDVKKAVESGEISMCEFVRYLERSQRKWRRSINMPRTCDMNKIKISKYGYVYIPLSVRKKFSSYKKCNIYINDGKIIIEPSEQGLYCFCRLVRIPILIRKLLTAEFFRMQVENGKIVLEPVGGGDGAQTAQRV